MKQNRTHLPADALDWGESLTLVDRLNQDGRYRDAMLISTGCNLGLRISDIITLKWNDLLGGPHLTVIEKKTGKRRKLIVNSLLREQAELSFNELEIKRKDKYIFSPWNSDGERHFSRIRAHQILKEIQHEYSIHSAQVFSTHSLRKTFGRRVWLSESEKGRGETALVLLSDVFGHSSIAITKRYLGIREDEINNLYESIIH